MASSKVSIYSALVANLLIAITKFIAGGISNSSSMISEGIHSCVDTANQFVLLYGIKRSQKPADEAHPFGYGKELYFWSFIVAILIFGLGGGVSIYQGITHMFHPEPLGDPTASYIVLGASIVFETISLWVAVKEFNKARGSVHWWKAVVHSKDPSSFLVLFEDIAALAGLVIVMVCVYLGHVLDMPILDGLGSLLVGLVLIAVSTILARESRSLLMGEGITVETRDKIKALVEANPSIKRVIRIYSTYQSPTDVLSMVVVEFQNDLTTQRIITETEALSAQIKSEFKEIRYVFIQPGKE